MQGDLATLTGRQWDCVVVGGGHNGLAAAAYLAGGGLSVVVLERRAVLGGSGTLERPFADGATSSAHVPIWWACSTR